MGISSIEYDSAKKQDIEEIPEKLKKNMDKAMLSGLDRLKIKTFVLAVVSFKPGWVSWRLSLKGPVGCKSAHVLLFT